MADTSIPGGTTEEVILQSDLTAFDNVVIVPNWEPGIVTAWKVAW
ncbi:hypothetical protein [Hyphomonas sp.]